MKRVKSGLLDYETYIFIDASNIRAACLKTLGWKIDFLKLMTYFQQKYPNLKDVRYYEGVTHGDAVKERLFRELGEAGYTVCPLAREPRSSMVSQGRVRCPKCGHEWEAQAEKKMTLKSNVDVYLATEFLSRTVMNQAPMHFILVSCDGDYAEMIKEVLQQNKNILVSVLGTPVVKSDNNTFSMRLQEMRGNWRNFAINNIADLRDKVENR